MAKKQQLPDDAPLEKVIDRLEEIVGLLESGEADLEKSIDLYREGKQLGVRALKRLDALERRIQLVVRASNEGELETTEFDEKS